MVEPDTGRVLTDADIVEMDRWTEVQRIWFDAFTANDELGGEVDLADVFTSTEEPAWSAISVTPDGLNFGTDRSGAVPPTVAFVSFADLGDLVMPGIQPS